jgi:hypothetical protein
LSGNIASLGLQINSQQATTAAAALDKLAASAGVAGTATDKLAAATGKSETQIRAIESMAKRAGVSFGTMNARVDAASTGHTKFQQTANAAAQSITNVANAAAGNGGSGSSGGSLANAADKSNSAFDRLANTLTRRVLFAAVANEARKLAQYVWNLNSAIAATADSAARSNIGGSNFQGLQTTAAYSGVDNNTFNGAMVAFNQQVDLAKHGLGDLQALLKGNGKTVGDTATTFGIVADMVSRAGSEAQKFSILQQAGLPASTAFVKLMEQGSAAIKAQAGAASKLSQQQLEDAQRIDAAWQRGWVNFEGWGKKAVVSVFDFMGTSVPAWFKSQGEGLYGPGGAYGPKRPNEQGRDWMGVAAPRGVVTSAPLDPIKTDKTKDIAQEKQLNAQLQARLAMLGPLATVEDQVKAKELELAAAGLNLTGVNDKQRSALLLYARAQAETTLVQNQAAVGVFNLDLATKAAGDTLQSWVTRKLLDPNNMEQYAAATNAAQKSIEQLANTASVAGAPLESLQRLANEAGSVRTQLDTFATTSMTPVTAGLVDLEIGDAL